jgi:hypothetical protein
MILVWYSDHRKETLTEPWSCIDDILPVPDCSDCVRLGSAHSLCGRSDSSDIDITILRGLGVFGDVLEWW